METKSRLSSLSPEAKVTLLGLGVNFGLFVLKLLLGWVTHSTALVASGLHSLSDMATDFVVLGGLRISRRPADASHPYGHGKFETLVGGSMAFVLFGGALFILWEALLKPAKSVTPSLGWTVALAALLSLASKEWLYRTTVKVGKEYHRSSLVANAWEHRSDAFSSGAVLIGGVCASFGLSWVDRAAAVVVAVLIGVAAGRILRNTLHELMEGALSPREREKVVEAIQGVQGVKGWHKLRTRRAGQWAFVDVHVQVDPHLSVVESHAIASQVEKAVRAALGGEVSVVVHIEPSGD